MVTSTGTTSGDSAERRSPLQIELLVEPDSDSSCSVLERAKAGEDVNQNLIFPEGGDEGQCCAEVTVDRERTTERRLVSSAVDERCICPVLNRVDCVSSIEMSDENGMLLSVTVPDREVIRALVADLRDHGATVKLRRINQLKRDQNDGTIELEADAITPKQREAIDLAIELGYYDIPRQADLEDLAEQLGVSRSAVSQRLNRAESRVIQNLYSVDNGT